MPINHELLSRAVLAALASGQHVVILTPDAAPDADPEGSLIIIHPKTLTEANVAALEAQVGLKESQDSLASG